MSLCGLIAAVLTLGLPGPGGEQAAASEEEARSPVPPFLSGGRVIPTPPESAREPEQTAAGAVRYLDPGSFTIEAGAAVRLRLRDGTGQALPWEAEPIAWLFVRVAGTQRNYDTPQLDAGQVLLAPLARGVGVAGVEIAPRLVSVSTADLTRLIAAGEISPAGPILPLDRAGPTTLRRVESLKAIVRFGPPGQDDGASEATGKTGQLAEIRPLMDPAAIPVGSDMAVRLYAHGAGLAHVRAFASSGPGGPAHAFTTDAHGIGHFPIDRPGTWQVHFVALTAAPPASEAAADLIIGTLVFEISAERGK